MSAIGRTLRGVRIRGRRKQTDEGQAIRAEQTAETPPLDIAPNDPIIAYLQQASGAVDVDSLELDSPAVHALKEAGVKLVVPLVTQGELVGLINLGPRLSERDYSADDRRLLANLAAQAAPALRVGQLVRQQEAEVRDRERLDQELRVAQLIQQQFLRRSCRSSEGGGCPPTTVRLGRSGATSTTSSSCPTAGSASSSATLPTRVFRRPS